LKENKFFLFLKTGSFTPDASINVTKTQGWYTWVQKQFFSIEELTCNASENKANCRLQSLSLRIALRKKVRLFCKTFLTKHNRSKTYKNSTTCLDAWNHHHTSSTTTKRFHDDEDNPRTSASRAARDGLQNTAKNKEDLRLTKAHRSEITKVHELKSSNHQQSKHHVLRKEEITSTSCRYATACENEIRDVRKSWCDAYSGSLSMKYVTNSGPFPHSSHYAIPPYMANQI